MKKIITEWNNFLIEQVLDEGEPSLPQIASAVALRVIDKTPEIKTNPTSLFSDPDILDKFATDVAADLKVALQAQGARIAATTTAAVVQQRRPG